MKKKFKIFDPQLLSYKYDGQWFSEAEATDILSDYHDVDWDSETDDGKTQTIFEFLETLQTDEDKLSFLCEHGNWDLHYYIYHDEEDRIVGGEWDREDKVKEYLVENPKHTAECRFYF